jgi:hypothetical protein
VKVLRSLSVLSSMMGWFVGVDILFQELGGMVSLKWNTSELLFSPTRSLYSPQPSCGQVTVRKSSGLNWSPGVGRADPGYMDSCGEGREEPLRDHWPQKRSPRSEADWQGRSVA